MTPLAFLLALPACTSPAPLVGVVAAVAFYHVMALADSLTGGSAGERRERERANARRATQERHADDPTDDRNACCCPCRPCPCRPRVRTIIPHGPHRVPRGRTGVDPDRDTGRADVEAQYPVVGTAMVEDAGDRDGDRAGGPPTNWVARRGGHAILDDHGSERIDLLTTQGDKTNHERRTTDGR